LCERPTARSARFPHDRINAKFIDSVEEPSADPDLPTLAEHPLNHHINVVGVYGSFYGSWVHGCR
jgi:hypothetical protein